MKHYIDKDALSAEINRVLNSYDPNEITSGRYALVNLRDFLDTLEVKELPIWEKVSPDTGQTTLYKDGNKSYLERFGYRIDLKDLDKLPKKNSTHRTPADIESAMQEVEAKSEAYTNAHRGERADDVLSQMRGEPVSEELDEAAKEWLRPQLDKSYSNYGETKMMELTHFDGYSMLEAIEFGAKWKEEQFEKNRLEHCNSITNEQAELEQKFLDEHLDKYNRMPTFLDAIEYGMRLQKEQMMKGAFEFAQKHNDACVLASECLRDHGWFNREHDFNDLFLYLSCVDELFAGKFSGKTKVIVIKED